MLKKTVGNPMGGVEKKWGSSTGGPGINWNSPCLYCTILELLIQSFIEHFEPVNKV